VREWFHLKNPKLKTAFKRNIGRITNWEKKIVRTEVLGATKKLDFSLEFGKKLLP